jgi:DNA transposition AAA+ family ATPase
MATAATAVTVAELGVGRKRVEGCEPVAETTVRERINYVLGHAVIHRDIGVIVGPPGLGKTQTTRAYCADFSAVMVTALGGRGWPKRVLQDILSQLAQSTQGSQSDLYDRLAATLGSDDRLVVIDEAQHLQTDSLEMLRQLHDQAPFPMVLVGNPDIAARLQTRKAAFAQIWSRVGVRCDLSTAATAAHLEADVAAVAEAWGFGDERALALLWRLARQGGWLRTVARVCRVARDFAGGATPSFAHLEAAARTFELGG